MTTQTLSSSVAAQGCGSGTCQCGPVAAPPVQPTACVNGIALHAAGQRPDTATLRELAYTELLRQQAVSQGLLPRHTGLTTPELGQAEREIIEATLDYYHNDLAGAAQALGITTDALQWKLEQLGIETPTAEAETHNTQIL